MGHNRLGTLPRSRKWKEVVRLIQGGAAAARVAGATLDAAERWFARAAKDPGVVEAVWLLMRLPLAARGDDFAAALRVCGLDVGDAPDLPEIIAAVTEAIDERGAAGSRRTDLGEIAQLAAVETLSEVVGGRLRGLFDTTPADVEREFYRLATAHQFGLFARDFFSRFTLRVLTFFVSRAAPAEVGAGRPFPTLAAHAAFDAALETHCREAARILDGYAGGWLTKRHYEDGQIDRGGAARFTAYAMTKLMKELRKRAASDGR